MFGGGGESECLVGEGRLNVWWGRRGMFGGGGRVNAWWGRESECLVGEGE